MTIPGGNKAIAGTYQIFKKAGGAGGWVAIGLPVVFGAGINPLGQPYSFIAPDTNIALPPALPAAGDDYQIGFTYQLIPVVGAPVLPAPVAISPTTTINR
jgi:hypothetical protein